MPSWARRHATVQPVSPAPTIVTRRGVPTAPTFIILSMDLAGRVALAAVCIACLGGLSACGSGSTTTTQSAVAEPLAYNQRTPLDARVLSTSVHGSIRVSEISYRSSDGTRVPALLATPIGASSRGCLMYQGGIGVTKEQSPSIWEGAAALGLSTFTIDPRATGARGGYGALRQVIRSPMAMATVIHDSVVDLRRGIDFLQTRPECNHNIGYLGTSFGGVLGAILAGQDVRIKAVILTSIGATWKQALLSSNLAARSAAPPPFELLPRIDQSPTKLASAVRVLSPYDPAAWVGKIAPRPLLLINGRNDPAVAPVDALDLADAAAEPKSVLYFDGGHNPFGPGPDQRTVLTQVARFLCGYLNTCPTSF